MVQSLRRSGNGCDGLVVAGCDLYYRPFFITLIV